MTSRMMIVFLIVVLLGFLFLQMKFSGVGWGDVCCGRGVCVILLKSAFSRHGIAQASLVSAHLAYRKRSYKYRRFIDDDFRLHSA